MEELLQKTHEAGPVVVRLKGKKKFDLIFAGGRRFRKDEASCIVLYKSGAESGDVTEAAVAVSKRNCRSAVKRNRIKRLLRESLRQIRKEKPELLGCMRAFVIYWNREPAHPAKISLGEVKELTFELLQKVFLQKPGGSS